MKKLFKGLLLAAMCCPVALQAQDEKEAKEPKKTEVEKVIKICDNLPRDQKAIVAVMPFKVSASGAGQEVGTGMPDMLVNALFNSGCFRVVERDRIADIMKEQGIGLSGAGNEASFAQVGKMLGAQVLVFGTITEFKDNESGGGGATGGIFRRSPIGGIIGGVGVKTAHLGYTLKFVDPNTGELLDTKSFDKKRNSVGAAGAGLFGPAIGGALFYKSKSMQDALEESLIEAAQYMSQNKTTYTSLVKEFQHNAAASPKAIGKEDCKLVSAPRKPTVMVIIPEEHMAGAGSKYDEKRGNNLRIQVDGQSGQGANYGAGEKDNAKSAGTDAINDVRRMFRPPDPAGETEIMKRFLAFGFDVIDAKQFEKLRSDPSFLDAFDNPAGASKLAAKFGADIILVGEAFSEYSKAENGMTSCRARVEVKAIMAKNAKILATDGLHGSGMDIGEVVAGKTALRNAGGKVADYFLNELCAKADAIMADMGGAATTGGKTAATVNQSKFTFTNVDYTTATALGKLMQAVPGVSKSERLSFTENIAVFNLAHTGDIYAIVDRLMANKAGIKLDVKTVSDNIALMTIVK